MKQRKFIRGLSIACSLSIVAGSVAAAPPQIRTAPQRVLPRSNAPQMDVQQAPRYSALLFKVTTGDDDLRSDSAAWVSITFPDQSAQNCALRPENEDTWENNTTHDAPQCVLNTPRTFDELKASKVVLFYGSVIPGGVVGGAGDAFKTTDNWNVNEVRAEALNPSQFTQRCLIDETGNPLVRMKNSLRSYDLSAAPSVC